jgi:predicted dehydrogenase
MINIGVVGCGQWGMIHVRVFRGLSACRVVAVADQDAQRLARVQEQYPREEAGRW